MRKKIIATAVYAVLAILVIVLFAIGTNFANSYSRPLTLYLGEIGGGIDYSNVEMDENGNYVDEDGNIIDTEYYKVDEEFLNVDGTVNTALFAAAQEDLCEREVGEGTVMLKNDTLESGGKALPLAKNAKVSVFGFTSTWWMTREYFGRDSRGQEFYDSLANAGLEYNPTLARFYAQSSHTKWGNNAFNLGNGAIKGSMSLDEVPWSEHQEQDLDLDEYKDAAIVVFSRTASEGGDCPLYMEKYNDAGGEQLTDEYHYLQLTPNEKSILEGIKNEGFTNTIVILHTGNPMEMTEIDAEEYGVTACLWVAGTGNTGVKSIGRILTGEITPSGHLATTFSYDNFSAPAMQNFSDNRFTRNGEVIDYSYVNYGEGIYVGYKYYETRYEDYVTQRANVGNYDYGATVARPFGYGLSYTDFSWSDFSVSAPDADGNITVTVTVTNEGAYAGKDVVQVYYQAPYTNGGTEKSAVELVDFVKTRELAAADGDTKDSQTVSVTFNVNDMKSYDEKTDKTYVLDSGSYYITAASDAHQAANNILAAKDYTVSSTNGRMTEDGNADLVGVYNLADKRLVSESVGGLEVTNQFSDYTVLPDAEYLSRSNWAVLDDWSRTNLTGGIAYASQIVDADSAVTDNEGNIKTHEVPESVYTGLTASGWDSAGNPNAIDSSSFTAVTTGQDNGFSLVDMRYHEYGDEEWNSLLAQMSLEDMFTLFGNSGWGTDAVSSVNKPTTYEMDGPQGLIAYAGSPLKGNGFRYPVQEVLGATWNKELVQEFAEIYAQECLVAAIGIENFPGVDGVWCPGVNIHRTPFSGRNWEYFGECGTFTGILAEIQVREMNSRGVKPQLKHFFLNDQETNRDAYGEIATFSTEQAIREIYLKAFQSSIESGESGGVMCSMNRLGYRHSFGNYNAITNVLRGEWGLQGAVITDATSLENPETLAALAAGCDMVCGTGVLTAEDYQTAGVQYMLRSAAKNVLYNAAFSVAMNGLAPGAVPIAGFPVYALLLTIAWIVIGLYVLYGAYEVALVWLGDRVKISRKTKWIIRGVAIAIAVAAITTLLIVFFTQWYEMLLFAFQTM